MKAADQLAAELQRENILEKEFLIHTEDKNLQQEFIKQLRLHFANNGLSVEKLKEFITSNEFLEIILADKNDANKSSLREHLLLTEQILNLQMKLFDTEKIPKRFDSWIKTEKLRKFLQENLKTIPRLRRKIFCKQEIKIDQSLRNAVEFALENNWNEKRIALHLCITVEEVKKIVSSINNE